MAASNINGGTTMPRIRLLSIVMLPNPVPNLRRESRKPIVTMIVGYDNFSLSLMMAPKKEKMITRSRTVRGEPLSANMIETLGSIYPAVKRCRVHLFSSV